jgi:hypothetical protein
VSEVVKISRRYSTTISIFTLASLSPSQRFIRIGRNPSSLLKALNLADIAPSPCTQEAISNFKGIFGDASNPEVGFSSRAKQRREGQADMRECGKNVLMRSDRLQGTLAVGTQNSQLA